MQLSPKAIESDGILGDVLNLSYKVGRESVYDGHL